MTNHLKFLSKSTSDLVVGNYMVLFGGRDLTGEFFTKKTQLESSYTDLGSMYVDFEHGVDPDGVGVGVATMGGKQLLLTNVVPPRVTAPVSAIN